MKVHTQSTWIRTVYEFDETELKTLALAEVRRRFPKVGFDVESEWSENDDGKRTLLITHSAPKTEQPSAAHDDQETR